MVIGHPDGTQTSSLKFRSQNIAEQSPRVQRPSVYFLPLSFYVPVISSLLNSCHVVPSFFLQSVQ